MNIGSWDAAELSSIDLHSAGTQEAIVGGIILLCVVVWVLRMIWRLMVGKLLILGVLLVVSVGLLQHSGALHYLQDNWAPAQHQHHKVVTNHPAKTINRTG